MRSETGDDPALESGDGLGRDLVTWANAITTGSLVAGFLALVLAAEGRLALAAVFIGVAATCDALDGLVARRTRSECVFGGRLDSLADLVSFGAAPAMMLYAGDLRALPVLGLGACVAFFVCGAWRLARFSLVENRDHFVGLAIPPAGVIAMVLALSAAPAPVVALITSVLALLMISTIPFPTLGRLFGMLRRSSRREMGLTGGAEAPEPAPRGSREGVTAGPAGGRPSVAATDTEIALERAEELAERALPARTEKRRMLVIVNPYATTVSDRLKNLVVYALGARYSVEAVETQAREHATELCREAAAAQYDLVVAFGGDGTVNEAANGLAGSDVPLTCLPGGSTNVFCRTLGIPADVVDATEHLLAIADDFRPRRVDLGQVDDRHFVFASGIGLDASVVERVDARPHLKASMREWYFTYAAVSTFTRRYLVGAPRVRVEAGGRSVEGITVIVQNGDPFTFFGSRPIRVCEGAGLEEGSISLAVLKRATALELPTVLPRVFSGRAATVQRHRQIDGFAGVREARVRSVDGTPFPLEVDGDYLGERDEVRYRVKPGGLAVVR